MGNKIKFCLFVSFFWVACSNPKNEQKKMDSGEILKASMEYILKNEHLAKEYTNQPLQVVQYKKNKIIQPLKINGKKCIILSDNTNVHKLLSGMNIYEPIPIVEIIEIKYVKDILSIDIILRATGDAFLVKLKMINNEKYEVIGVNRSVI